jgi:hypothetical protein
MARARTALASAASINQSIGANNMTPKRKYFTAAMQQDVKWLVAATNDPSPYMRPIHIALGKLAIRKKGGAA